MDCLVSLPSVEGEGVCKLRSSLQVSKEIIRCTVGILLLSRCLPDGAGIEVLLNFGAVDYEATVFVNGRQAGFHRGGYFAFTLDITSYLSTNGSNQL